MLTLLWGTIQTDREGLARVVEEPPVVMILMFVSLEATDLGH